MNKIKIIVLITLVVGILSAILVMTYQNRKISLLENQTTELKKNQTIIIQQENTTAKTNNAGGIFGWLVAIGLGIALIMIIAKQKSINDFDYEKFIHDFRIKLRNPASSVYQPLGTEVGCDLGYVKGRYDQQRVAVSFSTRELPTDNYDGEIPTFMIHNYLVDPASMKVHSHRKNLYHKDFLKYCRDVEFRSTGYPQAPVEVKDATDEAVREYLAKQKGAQIAIEKMEEIE